MPIFALVCIDTMIPISDIQNCVEGGFEDLTSFFDRWL